MRLGILHYFPGTEPHRIPDDVDAFCVTQPWELGAPPPAWETTWADKRFRKLLVPSEYCRQLYLRHTNLKPAQVTVVPNGVDLEVFRPRVRPKPPLIPPLRFLYIGGLTWRKAGDLLLDAWQRAFPGPSFDQELSIKRVGTSTYYRGQSADVPERADIRLDDTDYGTKELALLYRSASILVAPSRGEGFCLPVLEALASGVPVIVPSLGPTNEFVSDQCALKVQTSWKETQGVLHYEVDVDDLARCLRWAVENPAQIDAMRPAARAQAEQYGWERIAAQYAAVFKEIAG